ncbi:MAG: extracellular solute-binding protein [bacterium]|nr:extracellular solute-binding protein [bacterium]
MRYLKKSGALASLLALTLLAAACAADDAASEAADAASDAADAALAEARGASADAADAMAEAQATAAAAQSAAADAATGIADAAAADAAAAAALAAAEAAQAAADLAQATAEGNVEAMASAEAALAAAQAAADEALSEAAAAQAEADEARDAAAAAQAEAEAAQAEADQARAEAEAAREEAAAAQAEAAAAAGPAAGSIELDFLVFETPNLPAEFWDDAIARTVADFPQFKINKIVAPDLNIGDFLKQLAATDQLPDVMMSNFSTAEFIAEGLLLPFEPEDLERFIDPVGLGYTDGKQYALPMLTVYESGVFYNKDMFEAAGITAEPETWDEFINAALAIAASGETPFVIGGAGADAWAAGWPIMNLASLNVTGADPTFNQKLRTGEASFTDPIFVDALRPYEQMVAAGWLTGEELNLGYADLQQTFLDGAAAMYPMGSFFAGAVPMDHPFEIGIFPMPTLDGTKRLATYTSGGPAISARTPDPEAARLFSVEFATNVETNLDDLIRDAHIANNKLFVLPSDVELHPLITEVIEILADQSARQVAFYTFEVGDDALVAGMQNELWIQAQEMLAGRSAEEAAQALQDAWNDLSG